MIFSLKNYSSELFNLTRTVGKVELISNFTTAVCESWNLSDKYTWDNAGILNNCPWTRLSLKIIGEIKSHFFSHGNACSNLSQEIFAIDTWGVLICSFGHGRKRMLKPGFH